MTLFPPHAGTRNSATGSDSSSGNETGFGFLSAQGDAPVTDIANIMGELSPNACLVYTDGELQIFDPGYNTGIEKLDIQHEPIANFEKSGQEQTFTCSGSDYSSADVELNNAVNEVKAP